MPSPKTSRWFPKIKAQVLNGIKDGTLSVHEACAMYKLTAEELRSWQRSIERDGLAGLRATHPQRYRRMVEEDKRAA